MNITLRQIEAFALVAQFGSFVQAANAMYVTQAALSHIMRELEQNLGFKLFARTTRSVRLTAEGEIFLPYAQRILFAQESALECATALKVGDRGIVRLATTPILASTHLMSAIARYQEGNPGIYVQMHEALPDELVHWLEEGKIDLAIGPERKTSLDLSSTVLFAARLSLLCSRAHRLSNRRSVKWSELAGEKILLAKGGGKVTISGEINNAVSLNESKEIEHFTTLLALVSLGKHVGVATSYVEPFLSIYNMKIVDLVSPTVHRKVMAYVQNKQDLSKTTQSFINFLIDFFSYGFTH